ncbi:hypothetical protein F4780DRAFT_781946 [Xylariomycetidae sp. FL0641]|nr:hypothetical protein F4780DRAFT_781946 [Xylariomycetidae sp. FL0641]
MAAAASPDDPFRAGHFQTLAFHPGGEVTVRDALYGTHTVAEPGLAALLRAPALARLAGVHQHGVSGLLGLTPPVTRLEHSVGALLAVRRVGGSVPEQAAALLHDVGHTAMSHVVDFALSTSSSSFHEAHKQRYLDAFTDVAATLAAHRLPPDVLREERYPLVERAAPRLCADRLDYGLRDAVAFGCLALADAHAVLAALRAVPDARSPARCLALRDAPGRADARALATAYMAADRAVWGNTAHADLSVRTARLMRALLRRGAVDEADLWRLSDAAFWERMRQAAAGPDEREALARLESEGLPDEETLPLPRAAKVRTIDPDVWLEDRQEAVPLSTLDPEYGEERKRYIEEREALFAAE